MPDNTYYYQIPLPGTTHIFNGKCRNNCNFWDGNLHTTKGYNTCIADPVINKKCFGNTRLRKYSISGNFEECVNDFLCLSTCNECDQNKNCFSCVNETFNRNIISSVSKTKYCGECSENCLACSGPNKKDCNCFDDHYGTDSSAYFNTDFFLCRSTNLKCLESCEICTSSGLCTACNKNHVLNLNLNKCETPKNRSCQIYEGITREKCLLCMVSNSFDLDNNNSFCFRCSANCLHCKDFFSCLVCKDGFRQANGMCINYSPFIQNLDIEVEPLLSHREGFYGYKVIDYQIDFFFRSDMNSILDYRIYNDHESNSFLSTETPQTFFSKYTIQNCSKNFDQKCLVLKNQGFLYQQKNLVRSSNIFNQMFPECLEIKRKGLCTRCKSGYFLLHGLSSKCAKISLHRIKSVGFSRSKSKHFPSICLDHYFLDTKLKKCIEKIPECSKMKKNQRCELCSDKFLLSQDGKSCFQCSTNCLECTSSSLCVKCRKGYFLTWNSGNFLCFYD